MIARRESSAEEVTRLRACLGDLSRLTARPTPGVDPMQGVRALLDALLESLRLTFVVARLKDPEGGAPIEMTRAAAAREGRGPSGVSLATARVGRDGELGLVVAGAQKIAFPGDIDRLFLDVAAAQAALALQPLHDAAERQRAEKALHERDHEWRLIVDSIPGLVALLSPMGDVDVVNRQLLEFFGQTLDELRGWATNGTIHPEDLAHVIDAFSRSIASGMPYEIVQRFRRSDGAYRWFHNSGFPLRDAHGGILRWCVLLTDIDERTHAEQELRRSEAFLAEGQRLARMGNFSWCVATNEIAWSEQVYRMFEIEPGTPVTLDLIGSRVHQEDLPLLHDMVERAQRGVSDFEYQHRIVLADNSVKHLHLIAHRSRDDHGRLEYIGAVHDVTQRRVAEEALDKARSELAHVARATTVSALTASIAHEVNQPLSGILTNASTCLRMLAGDPPDIDGARETARRTIRDTNRASDVITRLRALFSKKEFTLEPLDLNDAAREVMALSSSDLQRKRVVIQSELADDLPPITGDRVQLQQVILNLLRNASEAMSDVTDRPRQLLVRTERDGGDRVRVTVRDSGVGVDGETMDKLFSPFYTTKSGGMGIGLSVSRSIVERHHGRLWAEPHDGPGATFLFSIPSAPTPD